MRPESADIAALYDAHARRVWRMIARLGVSPAHIEDVVQDVFLTAYQRLKDFEGRSEPETWLLGIAVRLAANARRAKRVEVELPDSALDPSRSPEEQLERRRSLEELDRVLSQLPDEQREIVVLMDLEQLTAPQVAEALDVKLNTIYSRLRLGRAALARALAPKIEVAS
ncbi:MAG: sigma-70 family RNA polymerase sigma factor [Archangium sp.]